MVFSRGSGFTAADVPDQVGRCFLVTGGNTGIGFETARVLAGRGARVLLACRNQSKAETAIERISAEFQGADLSFIPLDQADLASVRRAAELVAEEPRLDALINNAGIMSPVAGTTTDGFEHHFGINHLGCFALTLLLLPVLGNSEAGRVVMTSSLVHKSGRVDVDSIATDTTVKPVQAYANSKLANLLFANELQRRLRAAGSSITVATCHPGMAATDLSRDMSPFLKALSPLLGRLVNSASQGAWPTLQAACDPQVVSGGYYGPQRLGGVRGPSGGAIRSEQSRSEVLSAQLWTLSQQLTGTSYG